MGPKEIYEDIKNLPPSQKIILVASLAGVVGLALVARAKNQAAAQPATAQPTLTQSNPLVDAGGTFSTSGGSSSGGSSSGGSTSGGSSSGGSSSGGSTSDGSSSGRRYVLVTKFPSAGSTLWSIAQQHHMSLQQLEALNPQFAPNYNLLHVGDKVYLN